MDFISLFSGIGGLDLGLERAGLTCKAMVEKDDWCRELLARKWPDVILHDDVQTFNKEHCSDVTLIAGGFPCQDVSLAGNRVGIEGSRSSLFKEAIRICDEYKPKYLLLENVSSLLIKGAEQVFKAIAEVGYDCEWHCIPAGAVGAPHRRDRIFIIGQRMADINSKRLEGYRFTPVIDEVSGKEALANYLSSTGRKFWEHEPNLGDLVDGISTDVDARVIEGLEHRSIRIPRKRPPRAVVHRRQKIQALGNAVVPQVAEFLGQQIIKHHRKEHYV